MNFDEALMDYSSDEAEPLFNDASLPASPSTAGIEKLSTQEEHTKSGNVACNTFHPAAINIRGPHDAFHSANDKVMDLTGANHFYKLPPEIQLRVIELFEICRAPHYLMYLKEKGQTHHTRVLSVSKLFRDIYSKHLPIMLPSFSDEPIYIHKDTTVVLDMSKQEFCDLAEWQQLAVRFPNKLLNHLIILAQPMIG
ncbi:6d992bd5-8e63-45f6-8ab6-5b014c0533f6 [Sclerotinia trifoliorum]|uniref:6d992bd5-8e63-45f6-8ab6-5b014c0533f6 n=1 Tax=Sclerotinia trifoliorum TaxID=28548 RepID=A0A8H2ZRS4_9HELO|nr:6d992bd5-8e63-45f6-8ab6-5b014c0533f6 [Sclerotinia trifoliorum]